MTTVRCWLSISVALAVLGATPSLLAQSLEDQARVLFREGNELYAKGDYQGALDKFRKAKALHPSYKIDVNIGTTLSALGRHTEAAEHYDLFLRRADKVAPRDLVKEVATSLDELRRKLASVEVSCTVPGAAVEVDGKLAAITPLTRPIYLDPGSHRLSVKKLGFNDHEELMELAAGEIKRVTVAWQDKPQPAPAITETAPRPVDDSAERRRTKTIWAYSTLGVGGACVLTAVILYGVGASQVASAHDKYVNATDPDEIERFKKDEQEARDSAGKLYIGGHVLIGLGAVALGISIYQFVTRPKAQEGRAFAPGRLQLALTPGGAGLTWSGGF